MKRRNSNERLDGGFPSPDPEGADSSRSELIDWLREAYAMERALENALEKQAQNGQLSPTVRIRAATHLEETHQHAAAIEGLLHALGSDTPELKTGARIVGQLRRAVATKFARDERIKDLLDGYAMEHFEIACYTALITAAVQAGYGQIAETCRRILADELRMAEGIKASLPDEVATYLFESISANN